MALNIGRLFQKPKSWTFQHLEGLNVQEHHRQPASVVMENTHLPSDDEPLFASLAEDFAGPTKDEVLDDDFHESNKFGQVLGILASAVDAFKYGHSPDSEVLHLTMSLQRYTDDLHRLKLFCSSIPFQLSSPRIKGMINEVGSYHSRIDKYRRLPLTIIIARVGPEPLGTAPEVMPYLLIQIVLKYERKPTLKSYTAFVVIMKETTVQVVKAICSDSYIRDLINRRVPKDPLQLRFSMPYDLLEQEDRKEFLRIHFGLIRFLYDTLEIYKP